MDDIILVIMCTGSTNKIYSINFAENYIIYDNAKYNLWSFGDFYRSVYVTHA